MKKKRDHYSCVRAVRVRGACMNEITQMAEKLIQLSQILYSKVSALYRDAQHTDRHTGVTSQLHSATTSWSLSVAIS
jgi:hypothetical protein